MSDKNIFEYRDNHVAMIIKRRNGEVVEVLLDNESVEKINSFPYKWNARYMEHTDSYYIATTVYMGVGKSGKTIYLTRFLLGVDNTHKVDHKNHNTLDNRLNNLRVITNQKNMMNRSGINSNNKSGYRNVSFDKGSGKYIVQIQVDGKNNIMGKFSDVHEAGKFAEECRKKYYKINQ